MANKGLRNGTKQLEKKIGNVATSYVNLNNNDANLIVNIPLLQVGESTPLELSLFFNYQTLNTNEPLFGYGMRLNLYTSISKSGSTYYVTTADGAVYQYNYTGSSYLNNETRNTIASYTSSGNTYYRISDKLGNYAEYISGYNYPCKIHYINGKEINIDLYSSTKTITASDNLFTITFSSSSNLITGFTYTLNGTSLGSTSVTFSYSSNKISAININGLYPNKKQILLTLTSNQVKVQDNTLYIGGFFNFTNGKVSSITDQFYYDSSNIESLNTSVTYYSKKTVVTDYLNNSVTYYFDDNDLPTYEATKQNEAVLYQYNSNKLITYESSLLTLKDQHGTNLLGNRCLNGFSVSGLSKSNVTESSGILSTETVCYVTGSGSLSKTVTIYGITEENYVLYMLVKVNSSTSYLTVTMNGQSSSIRKLTNDGEYELIAVGVHLTTSTNNLSISISASTNGLYIGGATLLRKDFGTYNSYSSDNNLTAQTKSDGTTTHSYNSSYQVIRTDYPDSTYVLYEYNSTNKKVTKITSSEGSVTEYTYTFDTYNEASKTVRDTSNSKRLYTHKEYMYDNKLLYKSYEELEETSYFGYNSYGLYQVRNNDDVTRTTTFITNTSLSACGFPSRVAISKYSNSSYVDYTYDTRFNVETAESKNLSKVEYARNNSNDKTTTILNNAAFSKYEYNSRHQISKIKSAPISDGFKFEYDEDNHNYSLLKYVKYFNSSNVETNRYSFNYDDHFDLTSITYNQSQSPIGSKSFEYDENKNPSRIYDTNFEYKYKYDTDTSISSKELNVLSNKKGYSYGTSPKAISTNFYNLGSITDYELYPLNGNSYSINGSDRPTTFNKTSGYKPFVYNSSIGTHVLNCYYVELAFKKGYTAAGTLLANIYITTSSKQYIFYNLDEDDNYLALYVDNNVLYVELNGTIRSTNLTINSFTWYKVGLSFDEIISSNSGPSTNYKQVKVYMNSYTYETSIESPCFSDITSYIGRSSNGSYKLDGYMANLAFKESYDSNVSTLFNTTDSITISKQIDEIGLLTYKTIKPKSTSPYTNCLTHHYYPRCRTSDNSYKSHMISKEDISTGITSFSRTYQYDVANRIRSITNSSNLFGNNSYTYDYRGFLTSETFNGQTKSYTYDDNGNILTAGNTSFSYDSTIKDKLISVGGSTISYSSNNPLNPTGYDGWVYRYEGRRLVEAEKDNSYQDIKITFTYDEEGNIIKREYYRYDYEDEYEETQTTTYYYESGKLITEITPYVRNDYLYDSEGNLVGFIVNNTTRYFYITDILSNIIGIVDESGNIVTRYYMDAYGYNMIISGNTSIYNPFRYKGYYWDSDIEMYWCKSRFYVPYWRRWLNADTIEYLDVNNVGCVNLFAYCNNNPVMYSDGDGHMPQWLEWIIGGGLVVGAVALTIATAGLGGAIATGLGGSFAASVAGGAIAGGIIGAASGALINAGTQVINNGFSDFSWSSVGRGALSGMIAGAIAGGLFGGIQHALTTTKIAQAVSNLNQAEGQLSNSLKLFANVNGFNGTPFSGANIAKALGTALGNYQNAYNSYIAARATYSFVNSLAKISYFGLENVTSNLIGLWF